MFIKILSRAEMRRRYTEDPTILENYKIISINDPSYKVVHNNPDPVGYGRLLPMHPNVLSLEFHDVDGTEGQAARELIGAGYTLFSQDDAADVINFLMGCTLKDNLIIHCYAGISRSAACGVFAREMFGLDYDKFRRANPSISPNAYILKVLTEVYQEVYGKPHVDFLRTL